MTGTATPSEVAVNWAMLQVVLWEGDPVSRRESSGPAMVKLTKSRRSWHTFGSHLQIWNEAGILYSRLWYSRVDVGLLESISMIIHQICTVLDGNRSELSEDVVVATLAVHGELSVVARLLVK